VCVRIWRVFQLSAVVFQFRGFVFITVVPLFPRAAPSSLWGESDLPNDLHPQDTKTQPHNSTSSGRIPVGGFRLINFWSNGVTDQDVPKKSDTEFTDVACLD